jgi:hypothetical protein
MIVRIRGSKQEPSRSTNLILVRVGGHGVTHALGSGLVRLGLRAGSHRVQVALHLVTEVLGGGLLRVGLWRTCTGE